MAKATKKPAEVADKSAPQTADAAPKALIPVIKSGALSTDVGPMVISGLSDSYVKEETANKLIAEIESKRFDLLAKLTSAIVKAAKADTSIDLSVAFAGDKKKMSFLNDQLGLALGFRHVAVTKDTKGNERQSIQPAPAVTKFFPSATEAKSSPEYIRKNTVRTNFLHMLKKCAQAASPIVTNNITMKQDTKSGTLQLSGPSIQKAFGSETVLLNDKLTVGEGDKATKLKQKPSFTAMARMGAEAAGKELTTRKDSRVQSNAVDPNTALQSIADTLVKAIGKLKGTPESKTIESLKAVQSAITKVLVP